MTLYREDFRPGATYDLGDLVTDEDEIVAFASEWDPQFFHTDPETAPSGPFGGLVASGWHICAAWQRAWDDAVLADAAVSGLVEAEDIRWFRPWRAGEPLRAGARVLEPARPGCVTVQCELRAPDGELAGSMTVHTPVASRP